ncbi:hypothetical protein H3Z85_04490 [Chryseobacterium indologenes]|nr:hypothetical protein H3Z85_04490 [Chryseobacterium indologenes]
MYIQVSEDFKKKSKSAIVAITIFVVVYILLFLFTLLVTIACVVGGIALIIAKPMFLTLMLGVGAIGTGVFIFFLSLNFYSKNTLPTEVILRKSQDQKSRSFSK